MKYDGIFPETLALMAQNRFENSKAFYEEHKQEIAWLKASKQMDTTEAVDNSKSLLEGCL